jgi:Lar family restriction alleviation protein
MSEKETVTISYGAVSFEMYPCPFCGSGDIDPRMASNGQGLVASGCYECGSCGGDADTTQGAVDKWNDRQKPIEAGVLSEVKAERKYQYAKWGGPEHDDKHCLWDWARFIVLRVPTFDALLQSDDPRKDLIEIAALAVAAIESLDRKAAK